MCMAQPVQQTVPTNPAPYPLDKSYGAVKSRTITPDGKVHGGWTIAQQYQADMGAASAKSTPTQKTSTTTGANLRM